MFDGLPSELVVFHWHGETFDLPVGAELIASSEATKNQIFAVNNRVVGFQCHLETTAESLASINDACRSELVPAKFVQGEHEMVELEKKYANKMHQALFHILDNLLLTK